MGQKSFKQSLFKIRCVVEAQNKKKVIIYNLSHNSNYTIYFLFEGMISLLKKSLWIIIFKTSKKKR